MFTLAGGFAFGAIALLVLGRVWRELFKPPESQSADAASDFHDASQRSPRLSEENTVWSPWPQVIACAAVLFFCTQFIWGNTQWPRIMITWEADYTPPLFTYINTLFQGKTTQTQTIVQLALPAVCYILSAGVLYFWLKKRMDYKTAKLAAILACVTPAALYMFLPTHYSLTLLLCLLCCMLADKDHIVPALLVGLVALTSDVSATALVGVFLGIAIKRRRHSAMLAGSALLVFSVLFYSYLHFQQELPVLFYRGAGGLFKQTSTIASRVPQLCYIIGAPVFLLLAGPRLSLELRLFCALSIIFAAVFGSPWAAMAVNFPLYIMLAQWAVPRNLGSQAIIGSAVLCGLLGAAGLFYQIF